MNKIFYLVVGLLVGSLVGVLIYISLDNDRDTNIDRFPSDIQNNNNPFSNVDSFEELEYQDFDIRCLGMGGSREYIIRNQEDYNSAIDNSPDLHPNPFLGCVDYEFPAIDFNEYILLGKGVSGGGCSYNVNKNVLKEGARKEVIYQIEFEGIGNCGKAISVNNFILVPNIPSDYEIIFEVDALLSFKTRSMSSSFSHHFGNNYSLA